MTRLMDLHQDWMQDAAYRECYDSVEAEFSIARTLIEARLKAGLTQEQLAQRMETTQSTIARLETGRTIPSTRTLSRFAKATGTRLRISLETAGP